LGQSACAKISASVGVSDVSDGIVSLPFTGEISPVVVDVVTACECTSTSSPPRFVQLIVAEYTVVSVAVASTLPTPASSKELHTTVSPSEANAQDGVPVWTCVPCGAAVGSKTGSPDSQCR
jgi:hypothetical protein